MWLYFIRERFCGTACSGLCANGYVYFNAFFPCWFFYQFGSTEGGQHKLYAIKMASVEPLKWHNSQSLILQLSNCISFLGCLKTWLFISSYEKCALYWPDELQCSQAYSHLAKEIATESPAEENCSRTSSQLRWHITIPGELWKMSLSRLNPTDSNFKAPINPGWILIFKVIIDDCFAAWVENHCCRPVHMPERPSMTPPSFPYIQSMGPEWNSWPKDSQDLSWPGSFEVACVGIPKTIPIFRNLLQALMGLNI